MEIALLTKGPPQVAPDRTDEDLVRDLATGSTAALDALMARHGRAVATLLDRTLHDRSWIDDISQETFVRVFRRASTFRPGMTFKPWLYAIALNLSRDQNRRWGFWKRFLRTHPIREVAPAAPDTERVRLVREALSDLPEDFREVLVLCEIEGLSYAEASEATGSPAKTVSSRLARARDRFREAWLRRHPGEGADELR
ncbi:MAG: RNA polymerase sigma factor [Planctomycetota bacterium]